MTPLQRTTQIFRQKNLKYQKVEYWNHYAKKRIDLFAIIDIILLDNGIVGVQVCGNDFSAHKRKIMSQEKENTIAWLENRGKLQCWGWRKLKKVRGKKAKFWSPRIADVTMINGELNWSERK